MAFDKDGKDDLNVDIDDSLKRDHKLSRQRRYLEFPEGSSLQFVYDVVVAVVDNVNYISVSITVALAYELPSEPPSELLEDLKDRLKDGTYDIARNDTVSHVTYVDNVPKHTKHQPYRYPPQNYNGLVRSGHTHNGEKVDNTKYTSRRPNPLYHYAHTSNPIKYTPIKTKYPWWRLPDPARREDRRNQPINTLRQYKHVYPIFVGQRPREHNIYPILGKRTGRITNGTTHYRHRRSGRTTDKVERIHIRHQRKTRHDLYNAIEKYLDRKKLKGHYCVLRALCETARKSDEQEPGSFVQELMRAVFTIPEPLEDDLHGKQRGNKEQRYDAAQAMKGDCSTHCEHSLWSSSFMS